MTEIPVYNESDLPSPFLRKVGRLDNEKFKPFSNRTGSGSGMLARAAMKQAGLNANKNPPAAAARVTVRPRDEKVGAISKVTSTSTRISEGSTAGRTSTIPTVNRRQSTGILNGTTTLGSTASAIASGRIPGIGSSRPRASAAATSSTARESFAVRRR